MAPIQINIGERTLEIDDQSHLDNWLEKKLKRQSIIDENGVERDRFSRLVNGGTYTLGPPIQQQQQQKDGKLSCFSRILVFGMLCDYGNASLFLY